MSLEGTPNKDKATGLLLTQSGKRFPFLREIILDVIAKRLKIADYNRTDAAKSLGMSIRTLRNYINVLNEKGTKIPANPHFPATFRKNETPKKKKTKFNSHWNNLHLHAMSITENDQLSRQFADWAYFQPVKPKYQLFTEFMRSLNVAKENTSHG